MAEKWAFQQKMQEILKGKVTMITFSPHIFHYTAKQVSILMPLRVKIRAFISKDPLLLLSQSLSYKVSLKDYYEDR
jgi:hypothetical protein